MRILMKNASSSLLAADEQALPLPLLSRAIASAGAAVVIVDKAGTIAWVNDAFTRLSGYTASDMAGRAPALLYADHDGQGQRWQTVPEGASQWQADRVCRRKDGQVYETAEVVTPLFGGDGSITHYVAIQHDITQLRQAQRKDRHRADHDVLTGMTTRARLLELMQQAIGRSKQTRKCVAALFIDLDGFKAINDTHGHQVGDAVLKVVGERLLGAIRSSDTAARYGGDEFVLLLPALAHRRGAIRLGRKVIHLLAQPIVIGSHHHRLGASIGIAFFPDHGTASEDVLASADQAMYAAKRQGGNQVRLGAAGRGR
jgi:diguanylate cyclase (GGDEF)-like protein/PAS domain S-box-containing protein